MRALRLFEGFGVELEYMIVDRSTLAVLPVTDRVLAEVAGRIETEVERGPLRWSNELVLHVLELKTNGPAPSLDGLATFFQEQVRAINAILVPLGGRLMPTAMHPTMDPDKETRLWPHEQSAVYDAFHRIFGCRGHGWSNLQSTHLNLPFSGDEEFGRLHAAIRLLLPLLPALAASSPFAEGRATGALDSRLVAYRGNCARIPSITGEVVPEPVFSRAAYRTEILERMYRDIAPHDPEGVLQDEWLNARGAIARFDRDTIEIRVLDVQECPAADLAVLDLAVAALRALCEERHAPTREQQAWPVAPLAALLQATTEEADEAHIDDRAYLRLFGLHAPCSAGEVWRRLQRALLPAAPAPLLHILEKGPLARRILRATNAGRPQAEVYRRLCDCLQEGRLFEA
ncbi:MAG: carboxylate-amine ligase [Planctomycetaceae bacterium]